MSRGCACAATTPTAGTSDGFTDWLRRRLAANDYIGIALVGGQGWRRPAIEIESLLQARDCGRT